MSAHAQHSGHFLHGIFNYVRQMEPLPTRKNVVVAFILGFLLGAIGTGLYFRRSKEFFTSLAANLLFTLSMPGIGIIFGLLFSGAFGALRVHYSNQKLREREISLIDAA